KDSLNYYCRARFAHASVDQALQGGFHQRRKQAHAEGESRGVQRHLGGVDLLDAPADPPDETFRLAHGVAAAFGDESAAIETGNGLNGADLRAARLERRQ